VRCEKERDEVAMYSVTVGEEDEGTEENKGRRVEYL
jgi:hypothetical protein